MYRSKEYSVWESCNGVLCVVNAEWRHDRRRCDQCASSSHVERLDESDVGERHDGERYRRQVLPPTNRRLQPQTTTTTKVRCKESHLPLVSTESVMFHEMVFLMLADQQQPMICSQQTIPSSRQPTSTKWAATLVSLTAIPHNHTYNHTRIERMTSLQVSAELVTTPKCLSSLRSTPKRSGWWRRNTSTDFITSTSFVSSLVLCMDRHSTWAVRESLLSHSLKLPSSVWLVKLWKP